LLFVDESDIHLHPVLRKMWMLRGRQTKIPSPGTNEKLHIFAALDWKTGHIDHGVFPKKNGQHFLTFLEHLEAQRKGKGRKAILVLDNASYHCTHAVAAWLQKHADRYYAFWLPPYSPELNLIDRFWGHLKGAALANHYFGNVQNLEQALHDAVANFNRMGESIFDLVFRISRNLPRAA